MARVLCSLFSVAMAAVVLTGCATSTIASRRQERVAAYASLTPEQRRMVDQGQIRAGMPQDAVYIAWGPPSEILESESGDRGHEVTWIYHGQWMEETRYWTYREITQDGAPFLERHLESDYMARHYIRAEISFSGGVVTRWRTLPRPAP
jgi:hypothetical protein